MPSIASSAERRGLRVAFVASVSSDSVPPSPRLSARIMKITYFSVTTSMTDQKISDSTPKISARPGSSPCASWKHSLKAYSGLVPMSP